MKKKGKIILGCASLLIIGGVALAGWRQSRGTKSDVVFKEIPVTRGDLLVSVITTGTVQPENRLQIKPPIGGRIEEILVKEGDAVKKGQTLALMSSTDRAALIDAARAHGPDELAHWEEIYKTAPLIAPMKGLIIANDVEPGQTISAQDVAFIMSDHLIVVAQVDETDMAKIELGQKTNLTLDAYPDESITAAVTHIAFEARTVSNVTMYDVQVSPSSVPDTMRSGMTANVSFNVAEKAGILLLPASAVHSEKGRSLVYLKDRGEAGRQGQKEPSATEIETGLTDGKMVEVLSGVTENDIVLQAVASRSDKRNDSPGNPFSPFGGGGTRGSGRGGGAPPPPPH